MAKHLKGKTISAGKRISCNKLKSQTPKPQVGDDNNAIKGAFLAAEFTDSVRFSRMGAIIIKAVQAPVKRTADQVRGWSANLSFRTFKALQEQGVMA